MQLVKITIFEPARTAEAITPLLLELPGGAMGAISKDLEALLDHSEPALRSTAVLLKVRSGFPLDDLARRDPAALIEAVRNLPKDQAPATLGQNLLDLARTGLLEPGTAIPLANDFSSDTSALFEQLVELVDVAKDTPFAKWDKDKHGLAMAALAGMHLTADEDWPAGYDDYRVERADPAFLELGRQTYHKDDIGCYKCHGEHGQGTPGFPPLALSPWLLGEPMRGAAIVKFGLEGELKHLTDPETGSAYGARMERLTNFSNAELAAALTYARQNFGNFAAPVTPQDLESAKSPGDGALAWDSKALLTHYPFSRDRLLGSLPGPKDYIAKWSPPPLGVVYMLIVVTLCMGMILVITMLGGGPVHHEHAAHTPAVA